MTPIDFLSLILFYVLGSSCYDNSNSSCSSKSTYGFLVFLLIVFIVWYVYNFNNFVQIQKYYISERVRQQRKNKSIKFNNFFWFFHGWGRFIHIFDFALLVGITHRMGHLLDIRLSVKNFSLQQNNPPLTIILIRNVKASVFTIVKYQGKTLILTKLACFFSFQGLSLLASGYFLESFQWVVTVAATFGILWNAVIESWLLFNWINFDVKVSFLITFTGGVELVHFGALKFWV